jgi:hypothetical protein
LLALLAHRLDGVRPILLCCVLSGAAAASEDSEATAALMRARVHSLWSCYSLADARVDKGRLDVEVQPGGEVSQVSVDERYPLAVARCLSQRVRGWKFPAFSGEPRRVTWSLVYVTTGDQR